MHFRIVAAVTGGLLAVAGVAVVFFIVDWLDLEHRPEGVLAVLVAAIVAIAVLVRCLRSRRSTAQQDAATHITPGKYDWRSRRRFRRWR
jgi:UDP-N-acetylmuramyl pentapeptide phosphotransferase/UDP-N-acetylglucosamine-1-phosphate transferase